MFLNLKQTFELLNDLDSLAERRDKQFLDFARKVFVTVIIIAFILMIATILIAIINPIAGFF